MKTPGPKLSSSSWVAEMEQETGPRAMISALIASRPSTRPCSSTTRRVYMVGARGVHPPAGPSLEGQQVMHSDMALHSWLWAW